MLTLICGSEYEDKGCAKKEELSVSYSVCFKVSLLFVNLYYLFVILLILYYYILYLYIIVILLYSYIIIIYIINICFKYCFKKEQESRVRVTVDARES